MNATKILCASLLGLSLAGCATPPPTIDTGSSWRVTWIGSDPVREGSYIALTFDEDDRAFGTGGCNHWFAGYGIEGPIMRFSQVGSTRRACRPDIMQQEQAFFAALRQVRHWDRSPLGELRLWTEEGQSIRLQAQ